MDADSTITEAPGAPRDPRFDKFVSWALTGFAGLALAVGAYFFKDLNSEIKDLSKAVSSLKTEVRVARTSRELENKALSNAIQELKARVRLLEEREREKARRR